MIQRRSLNTLPYLLFFLSGAAALGCQMVWVRMFAAGLGHEVPAMLAVASAFLGGMAVGGWALGRSISRSANGARWYGGLELLIGTWSALSVLLIPAINRLALSLTGPAPSPLQQWLVVFALPFLTLLPATAAMGATLPAMDQFLLPLRRDGRSIGAIYGANTLGAMTGVLGSVFVLMPEIGFRASLLSLAALNLGCGATALGFYKYVAADLRRLPIKDRDVVQSRSKPAQAGSMSFRRIGLTIFFTGLFGIGFEIAGIRILSQVLENTVYTYAAALAVYLAGTALGAALFQRFGGAGAFPVATTFLLCACATACLAGTALMSFARPVYHFAREMLPDGIGGVLLAEITAAGLAFGLPTLFMGATFSHLVQGARETPGGVGRAAALNALGCALAAMLVGVWALPALGTKWTLLSLAVGYLLFLRQIDGVKWMVLPVVISVGFAAIANLRIVDLTPGAEVAAYREGVMLAVAVVRTPDGHRSLRVNNRLQMGGTAAAMAERRQAHIPLLLHPNPKSALFLGPGTGITLGAAANYPSLTADGVELVPEIVELLPLFEPENEGPLSKPNIHLHVADARRFIRTTTNRYDVIVADLFHPAQDGAGFLYTREHFQAIRERLNPGGLFCQWLPLHQLDETMLRSIVRTFLGTFSETRGFLLHFNVDIPALALIGTPDPIRLPTDWFERKLADAELRSRLRGVGLERPLNLLGCFAASPEALRRYAGNATLSTDNDPVVLFGAPRFSIRRDTPPHELLLRFLERCHVEPQDLPALLPVGSTDSLAGNLAGFIAARDLYLKGLVEEANGRLAAAIDAYLESARRSLNFTPAYARCVTVIQVMAGTDPEQARKLVHRLEEAQPAQPLARQLFGPLLEQRNREGEAPAEPKP